MLISGFPYDKYNRVWRRNEDSVLYLYLWRETELENNGD